MCLITKIFEAFAAKSNDKDYQWLPLVMHSLDTAGIIRYLVNHWLSQSAIDSIGLCQKKLEQVAVFVAMVHDLGKCTALFAEKISRYLPLIKERIRNYSINIYTKDYFKHASKTNHATASRTILQLYGCPIEIASIVGTHHGKPQNFDYSYEDQLEYWAQNYYGSQKEKWLQLWENFISFSLKEANFNHIKELPRISQCGQILLSALLIMADWLASNTYYFPLISLDEEADLSLYPDRVKNAWKRIGLSQQWLSEYFILNETEFENIFGFLPNKMQSCVMDVLSNCVKPRFMIIEAQMGLGKTEAALAAAQILSARNGSTGVFWGLPSQATANGIFSRLLPWASIVTEDAKNTIQLAHGSAFLNSDFRNIKEGDFNDSEDLCSSLTVHPWFEKNKRSLLADFVVGTVDQLLMAALKQKHFMLRHLGLANKVVVIDEVHSYDAFMNEYLDTMLAWFGKYNVPVVLLSATLTLNRRTQLLKSYCGNISNNVVSCSDYPLITYIDDNEVKQKYGFFEGIEKKISIDKVYESQIESFLKEKLSFGGCAGIIVNTVKKAQQISELLKTSLGDYEIICFHSQFTLRHRLALENTILHRVGKKSTEIERRKLIVVGTQILEQSLDIDFDLLITELSPIDLILQRLGRLHRHNRARPNILNDAKCYILINDDKIIDSASLKIYSKWLLEQTRRNLSEQIVLPSDIPILMNKVYLERKEEVDKELEKDYDEYINNNKKKIMKAANYCIARPKKDNLRQTTLDGFLSDNIGGNSEFLGKVRDGIDSIEVLALVKTKKDDKVSLLGNEKVQFSLSHIPSQLECNSLLKERIRLPYSLNHLGIISSVISDLEKDTALYTQEWQNCKLLKGELFLFFNSEYKANIAGFYLKYDLHLGLICQKEEKNG